MTQAEQPSRTIAPGTPLQKVIPPRLVEPYLNHFDARSRGVTHAIRFDAAALRLRFEQDRELGYELMRSFASVIVERLQATRLQLLDVYGRAGVS